MYELARSKDYSRDYGISSIPRSRYLACNEDLKTYGDKAIEIVSKNPYQLAKDIRGIGFISADTIAGNLGIAKDSLDRARAGVSHVLLEATSQGHCGLPKEILIENSQKLLDIERSLIEAAILEEIKQQGLTLDYLDQGITIFLTSYYIYEKQIAQILLKLVKLPILLDNCDVAESITKVEAELSIQLASSQKEAIKIASQNRIMIITGGPGTGKTTLVKSLLKVISTKKLKIKLYAPTGRAAKRLSESTGYEATTIHRLLEIDPSSGGSKEMKRTHYFVIIS